jgi:iron complex outermembrane receptor protein
VPGYGLPYIVRKPGVDPNYPNLPNVIDYVIEPTVNAGKQKVSGIDVDLRYRLPTVLWPTNWGRLEARLNGTYTDKWEQTDLISGNLINYAGTSGFPQGAISRWRHYATLDWTYGPWGLTVADTYQHGYSETYFSDLTGDQITRRVGDYDVWDLQARYNGFKNVQLALGIKNMFDRQPPVVGGVGTFQFGYDASYGDPRGRMYYGTLSVAFK